MKEKEKKEEKEEEKIPHMCESIGHRPFWGRCPAPINFNNNLLGQGTGTADHLTLLRLFMLNRLFSILRRHSKGEMITTLYHPMAH